jgi:hypothetical protein
VIFQIVIVVVAEVDYWDILAVELGEEGIVAALVALRPAEVR